MPFLKHLHAQHQRGLTPDLNISPQQYAQSRGAYRSSGTRDEGVVREATEDAEGNNGPDPHE